MLYHPMAVYDFPVTYTDGTLFYTSHFTQESIPSNVYQNAPFNYAARFPAQFCPTLRYYEKNTEVSVTKDDASSSQPVLPVVCVGK